MIVMRALRFYLGPGPGALSALAVSLSLAFLLHEAVEKPMRRRMLGAMRRGSHCRLAGAVSAFGGVARHDRLMVEFVAICRARRATECLL